MKPKSHSALRFVFLPVFLALALGTTAVAQTPGHTWRKQAPLPTAFQITSISPISSTDVWIAANGLAHTTDGGVTWETSTGGPAGVNAVYFLTPSHGWAAGNGFFHTTDGGLTWIQDNTWGTVYDIFFIDAQHGWASGNGGVVYRTVNGGTTWTGVTTPAGDAIISVQFIDPVEGWASSVNGRILHSIDGGVTWTILHDLSPPPQTPSPNLRTVQFFDSLNGWAVGGNTFLRTIDGGLNWTQSMVPAGTWMFDASFRDPLTGIAVGDGGSALRTLDGGLNWTVEQPSGVSLGLSVVEFSPDGQRAFAGGGDGLFNRTSDLGSTWTSLQSGAAGWTMSLSSLNGQTAWATNEHGEIARTTNGGAHWERTLVTGFDQQSDMLDIDFADPQNGWVVGKNTTLNEARIARSSDGGATWTMQYAASAKDIFAVSALDAQTAIAVGRGYVGTTVCVKTTDGGLTWVQGGPPGSNGFRDVMFLDDDLTGWLVGDDIHKTTDGGATWTKQYTGPGTLIVCVDFADAMHGWAGGYSGLLLHTTDGGQTWTSQNAGGSSSQAILDVSAVDANNAWVTGWSGFVARTTDAGLSWTSEQIPGLAQPQFTTFDAIDFVTPENGWVAGHYGIWRRTGPSLFEDLCLGDGGNQAGCTSCPCSNNAEAGSIGGCINSVGVGARLTVAGETSVSIPAGATSDLRFGIIGAPPNAFCILNSGDALAPSNPVHPCFGLNSGARAVVFDGLRCAITNTRRHGGRGANALGEVGVTNNPWGGEGGPPAGIARAGLGFVAGQTRYFQVINRDDPLAVCMRGLNTTQAVSVAFTP